MIELQKYQEARFILPSVVDAIDYESHFVLDVIQIKGELFKKDQALRYNGIDVVVFKKLKDYPIQTEASIENRLDVRRVRYFCNKTKENERKEEASAG